MKAKGGSREEERQVRFVEAVEISRLNPQL
jgi:hypothetical protein